MARWLRRRDLLGILLLFPISPAHATPVTACRRPGERIRSNGYVWECVRRRRTLVWQRLEPIPAASPAAPPATNPSPADPPRTASIGEIGPLARIPDGLTSTWSTADSRGLARDVFIARDGSSLIALDSTCTHAGCALAQWSGQLRCGCHGAVFDATTGQSISGPGGGLQPLRRLGVEVRGETVFVTGI